MKFLLDTHVVVWLATDPEQIPRRLRAELAQAEQLFVSAASAYELVQKVRLGKLPQAEAILLGWERLLTEMLAEEAPLTAAEMRRAGLLEWSHRDPFDRMLVAQAQLAGLVLVTKDAAIREYPSVACAAWE